MKPARLTTGFLVAWLLVLASAGTLGNFYIAGWALLTMLAAAPVLLLRQIDRGPSVTLSESIMAARR
jgi:hypothetical protein